MWKRRKINLVPITAHMVAKCDMSTLHQLSPRRFVITFFDEEENPIEENPIEGTTVEVVERWKELVSERGGGNGYRYAPMIMSQLGITPTDTNTLRVLPTGEIRKAEGEKTRQQKPTRHVETDMRKGEEKMRDINKTEDGKCYTLLATGNGKTVPAAVFMNKEDAEDFKDTLESLAQNGISGAKASYEIFEALLRD